jgi:uroporphyrinogen III methyltransferase/synthase
MTVYLVGAGPGDPGLLTARALELIAAADVIVHDRLIPPAALQHARPDAELVYAGKQGGGAATPQAGIERLLIEHGRAGRTVVRLKGGDPFVFGRGGEEAEALSATGVEFEVVPGVTAGVGAPAYAGIPVTHRQLASAVAFVTGHEDPSRTMAPGLTYRQPDRQSSRAEPETALDWEALAGFPGTLVVYMGVRQLESIAQRLIAAGRDSAQPAGVIERGTMADQRVVTGTLGTIAAQVAAAEVGSPAITVFGPVVGLRERLGWYERSAAAHDAGASSVEQQPLAGVSVAVTRARAQASELASRLEALGATVVEAPAIRIVPLPGPAPDLRRYDLLCLSSPNGVRLLFERLARDGQDARALAGLRIAAIGPGTAQALGQNGVVADIVPATFTAEGLLKTLAGQPASHVLVARAKEARDVLPQGLRERGAEVDVLPLYETVAEPLTAEQLAAAERADYITFTSSSTVRYFFEALGERSEALGGGGEALGRKREALGAEGEALRARAASHPRLASIGPVTSAALRDRGLEPDVEAERHDIDGLIDALVGDARTRRAATPA